VVVPRSTSDHLYLLLLLLPFLRQIRHICDKAERWRGAFGERRKVSVVEYERVDPFDLNYKGPPSSPATPHAACHGVSPIGIFAAYPSFSPRFLLFLLHMDVHALRDHDAYYDSHVVPEQGARPLPPVSLP